MMDSYAPYPLREIRQEKRRVEENFAVILGEKETILLTSTKESAYQFSYT